MSRTKTELPRALEDDQQAITTPAKAEATDRCVDLVQELNAIVWEMDPVTWKFTFVSDRAQDILGYPIKQWLNDSSFWQNCLLHPEDRELCLKLCITAINMGQNHEFQYRVIAADGRVVWIKDLVRVVGDKNGSGKLLRGAMVDITKEKEAEEQTLQLPRERTGSIEVETVQKALCKNEECYRSLVEAIAQIIWNTKAQGKFVTEQPSWSKFTGQTYEEYKGWGWLKAIHPDDQPHTVQAWKDALANRSFYEIEHRLRRYDGEYRYMSVRAVPVLKSDGSIREWVGVHMDITERKQVQEARDSEALLQSTDRALAEAEPTRAELQRVFMQVPAAIQTSRGSNHVIEVRQEIEKKAEELAHLTQALERSNRELDQFAYIASHDLKAPLRAIANLSEWIEEDIADQLSDESREHLNLMRKRVYRMGALIDGILQYSRAGRVQQVETVNVSALLSNTIELLAPPPDVSIVLEPGMPTLKTEKIPLEQVFMNLINNAIKYGQSSDTRVQVSVRDVGRYYEFAIADNGPGIAPEYHQKIWLIFQRLQARDQQEGTGIGLSVVKKIVESRGGRVWLESELGAGATFRFTWPKRS